MPEAQSIASVRAALTAVLVTRQPHTMVPQYYDVPDPARPGQFVERHWLPVHTPMLDATGQVNIIQSVQDMTASHRATRQLRESQAREQLARADAEAQRLRLHDFHRAAGTRPFNFSVLAARAGAGRLTGVQVYATDVTEQVRARQQVQQLNEELAAHVQARTRELFQAQTETETQHHRLHQLVAEAPA